jgi:predicted lactoylglutathione lyase
VAIIFGFRHSTQASASRTQDEPWSYSANFADPDSHQWEISWLTPEEEARCEAFYRSLFSKQ